MGGGRDEVLQRSRNGADDEGASNIASDGERTTWWQAGEILGISARQMRRWKERYEE